MANMLETSGTTYSPLQRAVSLTVGMAFGLPMTTAAAMANGPAMPMMTPQAAQWGAHSPAATIHAASTNAAGFGHSNLTNMSTTLVHTSALSSSTAPALIHARQSSVLQNLGNIGVLNLASSKLSFLAGNLANFQSLTIDVAGHSKVVDLNTKLTAAEMVAAEQVLSGAGQTIKIGATGAATGGQVNLNNGLVTALDGALGGSLTSLTVAHGVSVVDNLSSLSLAGNLFNYGSILTASGTLGGTDAITANNVVNARGGSIGSYTGGNGLFSADLNLTGLTSVVNAGTISSVGNLNVVAPSITNTGAINSATGNVNFASPAALNFVGTGGTVTAASNVNFASGAGGDINLTGGNFNSQQVNFTAGLGNVNAAVDQVSGVVNAQGNNVHVFGNSTNLAVGTLDAANDPILANTGNLDVSALGAVSGQPYTLIAGGNITGTSAIATDGGQVNLIAGAAFKDSNGGEIVTGASKTGGSIMLGNNSSIDTSSGGGTSGGDVQLIAYAGSAAGSGVVSAPNTPITAANVTVIAGAKSGNAIQIGNISTTGTGGFNQGNIILDAAAPVITVTTKGTSGVVFDSTGAQTANVFSAKTLNAANISVTNANLGGTYSINTAGSASITNTIDNLNIGEVTVGKTGTFTATAGGNLLTEGNITGGTATLTSSSGSDISTIGGSINTTTLNINNTVGGNTLLTTDVSNLVLNTTGNVVDMQGTATIGVSGNVAGGRDLNVTGGGQVNVNGALFVNNGSLELSTTTTSKGGIGILAPVLLGNGSASLNAVGKGVISEAKGVTFAAGNTTLNTANNIGTASAPFTTNNTASLTVNNGGAKAKSYVADTSFGALTFNGQAGAPASGGSIYFTSSSSALTLGTVNYATVSITDAAVGNGNSGVILSGAGNIGTGTGVVTINSASGISQTAASSGVVQGTTVNLGATAPNASIGSTASSILVSTPILNATSTQGSVYISDNKAVTVTGGSSIKGFFDVVDTGAGDAKTGNSLTTGKAITGGVIVLVTTAPIGTTPGSVAINGSVGTTATQTVSVNSGNGLTSKGTILGNNINLTSADGPVTVGGKIGDANTSLTLTSNSATGVTITSPLSGHDVAIIATAGPITTKSTITGQGAGSVVTLDGTSATATGNAVVVGGVITGATINLGYANSKTGQGNIAINSNIGNAATGNVNVSTISDGMGGSITGKGLITGTNADLGAQNSIGTATAPIQTAVGTLSTQQISTASGNGAFITQKGNLNLGTSSDNNLVVKVTGALDVTGTVAAPNYALSSTGNTVIDGTLTNTTGPGPTTGKQTISVGGNFTISQTGQLTNTVGSSAVTATVTGTTTIDGKTSVDIFNLTSKGGFNLTSGALDNDGADNITTTGPVLLAGTIGTTDRPGNFGLTTNGNVTLAPGLTFIAGANITGATITNYTDLNGVGNVSLTATGTGNAFINNADITGINITIKTTSPSGVLLNSAGAEIVATQKALQNSAPTINLDTYNINNQGLIQSIGLVEGLQGALNITSPGALNIQGKDGSFAMNYFSAVNIVAGGNVTVGGIVDGKTSNPFSNFNAANELGTFTLSTPGTFSSPLAGISVVTNTTGSFGGVIAITASNVLYNGTGSTPVFALSAVGAGPTLSGTNKSPVLLDITGSQGLSVGAGGRYTVNVEGYGNTSLTTLETPGVLSLNTTDPSMFNVNFTSLALTGSSRVLITGNLDEGTKPDTVITINTNNTNPFLIGGANATTGNGQTGLTNPGQGISAGVLTINTGGAITVGTNPTSTGPVPSVLTGTTSVNLTTNALTVNPGSDISGLALNVQLPAAATSGDLTYTNLATNGYISASAINLTNPVGNVILSSGSTSARTVLAVGTNPNGPAISGVLLAGGAFNISAQGLKFSSGGLTLNATGGIDGGIVDINLSGISGAKANTTITIGKGAGQISANIADSAGYLDGAGTGQFTLVNAGNIIVDGLDRTNDANSSIQLGGGGSLAFVANPGVSSTGSTVLVDGSKLSATDPSVYFNLFNIASSSSTPLLLQGASANGGNGITGTNIQLNGGDLAFSNFGNLVTSGVVLKGSRIDLISQGVLDVSANSGFTAGFSDSVGGTVGGEINLSAQTITVNTTGLALRADGGSLTGGSINVSTTVTPIVVGETTLVGGSNGIANAISFDVGRMQVSATNPPNYVAGNVTIVSPGALKIDGSGIDFYDNTNPGVTYAGFGGNLNLTAGPSSPITFTNANLAVGLNFSTITFNLNGTSTFDLANASASGGNGIVGTSVLTAGTVVVNNVTGGINVAGENLNTHAITLTGSNIAFGANQIITLQPDGQDVGTHGQLGSPFASGDGGDFTVFTPSFTFASGGGVTIDAAGQYPYAKSASSTGGVITINYTGTKELDFNSKTFAGFDVSNVVSPAMPSPPGDLETAGSIVITSNFANVNVIGSSTANPFVNGTVFTYGDTGGSLAITTPNLSFTNISALSANNQDVTKGLGLASITFTTNSATPFVVGGATGANGITDANPQLNASLLTIINNFVPTNTSATTGIDMTNGTGIVVHNLTLTTPGVVTFAAGGTYQVEPGVTTPLAPNDQGVGGLLNVTAGSLAFSGTSANPTTFLATGNTDKGSAGAITFVINGTTNLAVGTGAGDLAFNVNNAGTTPTALAGTVSLTTGGSISADLKGLTYGPAQPEGSGSLILSGSNVLVSNVDALNAAYLQSIDITTTSASDFMFGNATVSGFADTGAKTLSAFGVSITNNGTGLLTGGINTVGTTLVQASNLTLDTLNTITLGGGAGGGLTVTATKDTAVGGKMILTAADYVITGGGSAQLSAIGDAGGAGGTILLTQTSTLDLNLNNTNGIAFVTTSGAGSVQGGVVNVTNSGNIKANGDAFTFGVAPAGNLGAGTLVLTGPNVLITNAAALNAQPLNSFTVNTSSNTDFSIGGATLNGFADVTGKLTANQIFVNQNTGGTLYGGIDATGLTKVGGFTLDAVKLSLATLNTITFAYGTQAIATEASNDGTTSTAGGGITIDSGAFKFVAGTGNTVTLTANASTIGGTVSILNQGTADLTVGAGGFVINAPSGANQNGGTVSVINGGAIHADGNSITFGSTYPTDVGPALLFNANGVLSFSNAGHAIVDNMAKLTLSSDSASPFLLGGATAGQNGITDSGLTLKADMVVIGNQGGAIAQGTAAGVNSHTSMSLNASTDVGTTAAPIVLSTGDDNLDISVNAGGNAAFNVTNTGQTAFGTSVVIGALNITSSTTAGNLAVGYAGVTTPAPAVVSAENITVNYNNTSDSKTLTVGSLQSFDGDLTVTTASGSMLFPLQAVISAYNGNILFQNTNLDAGSNITFASGFDTITPGQPDVITAGATIRAVATVPDITHGNVTIVMGPTGFASAAGTNPGGVLVVANNGGKVTFGAQGSNPNGSITTSGDFTSSLQGLGRALEFNTTAALGPSAINVGSYVTITADPPGATTLSSTGNASASTFVPTGSGAASNQAAMQAQSPSSAGSSSATNGAANGQGNAQVFNAQNANVQTVSVTAPVMTNSGLVGQAGLTGESGQSLAVTSLSNVPTINANLAAVVNTASVNAMTAAGEGGSATSSSAIADANGGKRTLTGGVSNNARRSLDNGPLLLSPLQDTVVDTPAGAVKIAAGSMALIISSDKGVAIYNLHDTHKGAIAVKVGGDLICVSPGRSVVISNSSKGFEMVNPAPFVGYRRVSDRSLNGFAQGKVFHADFDITSVIRGLPAVRQMMGAKDGETRAVMANMLKTAAILSQSGNTSEPYAVYLTPEMTAYANTAQH